MRLVIVEDYEQLSRAAAEIFSEVLSTREKPVIGLATGSTPLGLYNELVSLNKGGNISFANVTSFNLDEYLGLSPEHPQSYHYFMWTNLFSKVDIKKENVFIPRGDVEDVMDECRRYEDLIEKRGPIDLQLLGIGTNGHIGFNEPGVPFGSTTQVIRLTEKTIKANARFFQDPGEVPRWAISMGIKTIMHARRLVLLASGLSKASAIARTVEGPVTEKVPASILQVHPDATIIVDKEAASRLTGRGRATVCTAQTYVDNEGHNVLGQCPGVVTNEVLLTE